MSRHDATRDQRRAVRQRMTVTVVLAVALVAVVALAAWERQRQADHARQERAGLLRQLAEMADRIQHPEIIRTPSLGFDLPGEEPDDYEQVGQIYAPVEEG